LLPAKPLNFQEFKAEYIQRILTSKPFVPLSIKSSFVNTPNVRSPKKGKSNLHIKEKVLEKKTTNAYLRKIHSYIAALRDN
jgi:hypothetical protein